jgi:hypothetical protein
MTNEKTILRINIYWMIVIYAILGVLSFYFSIALGIIMTTISISSLVCYLVIGKRMKAKYKESNKTINETNS